MAKIILGKRPDSFKRKVTFPMLDGSDGAILCTFKYRTKTEFGAFIDGMVADSKAAAAQEASDAQDTVDAKSAGLADIMAKTVDKNADYLMDVLKGWDIDGSELTRDNCAQLADELPGAAVAIIEAYRHAVQEGRLGN